MPVYKDTDPKTGEIRWRYRFAHNGERHSGSAPKGHNTKRTAERLEKQHLEKLIARQYTGVMPTVAEFAERFLEYQKGRTKPLTQKQQTATIERHIKAKFGKVKLDRFGLEQIDQLVTEWSVDNKQKTINTRLGTVRRMLSLAVEWDLLPKVPRIKFVKVPDSTPRWLTDDEMTLLIEAAEPHWKAMILVGLRTGLRIGELRGLQWGDIDLVRRVVQVKRTDPGRRTMDATAPKGNRERTVPLTNDAAVALRDLKPEKGRGTDFVWPALLRRSGETRNRARSEKGCWHAIERAAERAGLENVAWHTLRHTYASHLVMRGVPLRTIQGWLGHASITETEKYSHLAPDFGHAAADLLDSPLATPDPRRQQATNALPEGARERSDSRRLPRRT